jgi:hypothetical protein
MLPFVADLDAALREVRRVLSPRGYFSFTTFGPDTLRELRSAWASVDQADHVHPFFDMHDIGDALGRAGFADPVMDVDRYRLTYPNTRALMQDLKATGAQNALADRRRGLTGRAGLRALEAAYEILRDGDGRLPVSCEVIYGQAWCPGTEAPQRGRRGETVIPLDSLRRHPKRAARLLCHRHRHRSRQDPGLGRTAAPTAGRGTDGGGHEARGLGSDAHRCRASQRGRADSQPGKLDTLAVRHDQPLRLRARHCAAPGGRGRTGQYRF